MPPVTTGGSCDSTRCSRRGEFRPIAIVDKDGVVKNERSRRDPRPASDGEGVRGGVGKLSSWRARAAEWALADLTELD